MKETVLQQMYCIKILNSIPSVAAGFSCNDGDLRLEGGNTSYDGRVEVCVSNKFTTVCDDGTWGQEEALVVCRQLNFTDGGSYPTIPTPASHSVAAVILKFIIFCCILFGQCQFQSEDRRLALA